MCMVSRNYADCIELFSVFLKTRFKMMSSRLDMGRHLFE